MDILKAFSLYDKEYPINIQGTVENPLFQANQIGRLLDMTNINKVLASYSDDLKVLTGSYSLGGMQKTAFLTESGLYRLLARSTKPIANTFQKWMVQVLKEIRLTGEYKLKQQLEIDAKLIKLNAKMDIHNKIIEYYSKKNVVYICQLRENDDDTILIKIGSSQNIKQRIQGITTSYGVIPIVLDIFESLNHTQFEKFLRDHDSIKSLYHATQKMDGVTTRETYLVNDEQYAGIIRIAKSNVAKFLPVDNEELTERINEQNKELAMYEKTRDEHAMAFVEKELEKEEICRQIAENELRESETFLQAITDLREMEVIRQQNMARIQADPSLNAILEPQLKLEEVAHAFLKRRVHSRSPKVCQYDKTTLELLNIYDSIIDVIRKFNSSSPCALKDAAKNRTIYKDYRWMMMDRESTETPVPQPTVESHQKNIEPIAMIDIKQTKILEVYACQRDAASARNLAGFSTISRAIKNKSISSGHYWNFFNQCSQDMRDEYLSERDLPQPHIKTNGNSVIQYDPISNKEVARYHSITEVVKRFQMSPVSLRKYAATGEPHNGFKWKIVKASE